MNLRFGLPTAVFLVFLMLSVVSFYYNLKSGEKHDLNMAISDALSQSERLARTAQTDFLRNKAQVDSDLGVESTDMRVAVLAVMRDDGTIQAAHSLAWNGRNIVQTVPGFDLALLKTVTQGRLPNVQVVHEPPRRLRVLMPFVGEGSVAEIRSLANAAVYLEYDLSHADALNRWYALQRWEVEAGLAVFLASLLSYVLYRRVARPLSRIEEASRMLSDAPDSGLAVPVSGPYELRQLATAFNTMAAKVLLARREMETQAAKLAAIVGSAMDAIITVNGNQQVTMINDAALTLFGYSREQAMGMHLDHFLPLRFRSSHAQKVRVFGQAGEGHRGMGQRGQFLALRANGEEFPILASISHLVVDGDELYTVILQDIGKQLKAEEDIRQLNSNLEMLVEQRTAKLNEATQALELRQQELSAARDELQNIFDSATVGILLARGRALVSTNPKAASMLGYGEDELNGQSYRVLYLSDADCAAHETILMSRMKEAGSATTEVQMARKDGSTFWVRINARLLTDGPMKGMTLAFLEDVDIEHATSQALQEAKEKAEEANRIKANFLANMSHEIRTPMNAIIGMSHLALQTNLDKRQRNYIEKVHRSGASLLGIINDILDFSKIEAGKLNMEDADFDLEDVMANLANIVSMKTEDKGLEFLFNISPDVPTALVGDPLRLGQVLINLGNNAVKFTHSGEIVIGIDKVSDVEDVENLEGGVELHFWVRDTGIGMTVEQCDKLFQSFSQADASTTRKYGGTGLGLAICKSLVESMGGRIWAESVAGTGSTFHFQARFGVQHNPRVPRMFRSEELSGLRVLVVDDNASAREIMSTMATTFGLVVEVAGDGAAALRKVLGAEQQARPFELVLMDWKMPEMDGIETVRLLREEPLRHPPTIIMITSQNREDALLQANERKVLLHTVLTKPVTPSSLLEAIGEALGNGPHTTLRKVARMDDYAESTQKLKGARVLLVEDNDMNQELARELFTTAGMDVVLANHGRAALDILAVDQHFDGILMDCQMPVMDGYEATRMIRLDAAFKDIPIIAMTANAMAGDKEKVLQAGMCDHIGKPLNLAEMFRTMAKWIAPARPLPGIAPGPLAQATPPAAQALNDAARNPLEALQRCGIDTRFGMRAALNKEALYLRLLVKFCDGQANFEEKFVNARAGSDPTAAERCAHTLSGSSATVGATGLHEAARKLEQACKQQAAQESMDALLQAVVQQLGPVIAGIKGLQSGADQPAVAAPVAVKSQALLALRTHLMELMDQGDSRALDLCEEHDVALRAAYPNDWGKMVVHLRNIDFESALQLFKTMG